VTNLPVSKAGDAIGLNSVEMTKMPLKGLSGKGFVTSAEIRATTLGQNGKEKKILLG
jgi:hypothetical protein